MTKAMFPTKFCKILGKTIHLPKKKKKSAALPVPEQQDFLSREKPLSSLQLSGLLPSNIPRTVVTGHRLLKTPTAPSCEHYKSGCTHVNSDTLCVKLCVSYSFI